MPLLSNLAVRVAIQGCGTKYFQYQWRIVELDYLAPNCLKLPASGLGSGGLLGPAALSEIGRSG